MCGLLWFFTWPRSRAWRLGQARLHVAEVRAHDVEVHDERRRDDLVAVAADRVAVQRADAIVGLGDQRRRIAHGAYSPRSSRSSSQRDSGPRGSTGQTSVTRPPSSTWYASKYETANGV